MSFEVEGICDEYIMKEKENRIRVPFTLSVRDDFIVDTIRWDLP